MAIVPTFRSRGSLPSSVSESTQVGYDEPGIGSAYWGTFSTPSFSCKKIDLGSDPYGLPNLLRTIDRQPCFEKQLKPTQGGTGASGLAPLLPPNPHPSVNDC